MSNRTDESASEQPQDLTDLSELSFSFEEASTADAAQAGADELDIDQFKLEGDSDSPLPAAPATDTAEPSEQWFVNSLGQALGPMPLQDVVAMIHSGNLSYGDQVRGPADPDWMQLETVPALAAELPPPAPAATEPPATVKTAAPAKPATTTPAARDRNDANASRPATTESSKAGPGRKRKKKKKQPKKDELLNEIFSEVFDEDGKVRSEDQSAGNPEHSKPVVADTDSATPAIPTMAAGLAANHGDTSPLVSSVGTTAPDQPVAPVSQPPVSPPPVSPPPAMTPSAAASLQAAARPMPAAALRKKKKKRYGGGFSLEPKMLGIGAALLLLVLAGVGVGLGYIPLGGGNMPLGLGGATDPDTIFSKFDARYTQLASQEITSQEWQRFLSDFGIPTQKLAMQFMPRAASDPEAKQVADAITAMIKLMSCPYNDKEKQSEHYGQFKTLMASTQS